MPKKKTLPPPDEFSPEISETAPAEELPELGAHRYKPDVCAGQEYCKSRERINYTHRETD